MHAHTSTLHTKQMVASTWLGDHQGRPSAPTNSLHRLHTARYQVHRLQLQLQFTTLSQQHNWYRGTPLLIPSSSEGSYS